MPVFAVLAHAQPELTRNLVDALAPYPVVLHVDAKADADDFDSLPRTTYVRDRVSVNWGGFSVVEATLRLFESALAVAEPNDHIVLLSGQCFPTQRLEHFIQFLGEAPHRQHCLAALVFDGTDYSQRRLSKSWYFDVIPLNRRSKVRKLVSAFRTSLSNVSPRKDKDQFLPYLPVAGSQWIALTAECLLDILPTAKSPQFQGLFKRSLAPDEMFFHTLVYNSRWRGQTASPSFVPRSMRGAAAFANFHYIDASLSRNLTVEDLPAIRKSGAFFARKMSLPQSRVLLESLDKRNQSA
jgi:hypothetical protein